jgi:hypothetical protein
LRDWPGFPPAAPFGGLSDLNSYRIPERFGRSAGTLHRKARSKPMAVTRWIAQFWCQPIHRTR